MPQLKNRIRFAIDCKSDPVFLYAGRSPSIMEIPKNSLSVNLTDGSALIYQALHLAKSLPFTDTSSKMGLLSVNGMLEKSRLRTKWSKTAFCP